MENKEHDILWLESGIFYKGIEKYIQPADVILDIDCGIRPQQFIVPKLLICVEPYDEYAEILRQNFKGTNTVIIRLDAMQALSSLPDNSIETIFLMDVIEHMVKEVGQEVIKECERVANKQIIIFTPLGYMPQEIHAENLDAWNLHGGTWQEHKSGWYPENFPLWKIIACKHLHTHDSTGKELDTPYGGFYAIKFLPKSADLFNDIYAQELLTGNVDYIEALKKSFPNFVVQTVNDQIAKSSLKCALRTCQRTTQLFIDLGAHKTSEEILKLANDEKVELFMTEAREFLAGIRKCAAEFGDINEKEAELVNCKIKINDLKNKITDLEMEIQDLRIQISKNVWLRIYSKLTTIFKK